MRKFGQPRRDARAETARTFTARREMARAKSSRIDLLRQWSCLKRSPGGGSQSGQGMDGAESPFLCGHGRLVGIFLS